MLLACHFFFSIALLKWIQSKLVLRIELLKSSRQIMNFTGIYKAQTFDFSTSVENRWKTFFFFFVVSFLVLREKITRNKQNKKPEPVIIRNLNWSWRNRFFFFFRFQCDIEKAHWLIVFTSNLEHATTSTLNLTKNFKVAIGICVRFCFCSLCCCCANFLMKWNVHKTPSSIS